MRCGSSSRDRQSARPHAVSTSAWSAEHNGTVEETKPDDQPDERPDGRPDERSDENPPVGGLGWLFWAFVATLVGFVVVVGLVVIALD